MDERTKRPLLLICGDLHNLGDLALTLQNLELARADGRTAYVRRWAQLPDAIEAQVKAAGGALINGRAPAALLAVAARADIVIGGGQLVRDNISHKALALLFAAVCATRAAGGTVTTRGLGVSRVQSRLRRLLWRGVLRLCDRINVRDAGSVRNALLLSAPNRVALTADMAFLPTTLHDRLHHSGAPGNTLLIAPCRDGSEGRSLDGPGFAAVLAAARAALPCREIAFACHDPRTGMDGAAADAIDAAYALDGVRLEGYGLDALFSAYTDAALVITNRLHSVVFALLAERPVLVVDDGTHKIASVAELFDLPVAQHMQAYAPAEAQALVARALAPDRAGWGTRKAELAGAAGRHLALIAA